MYLASYSSRNRITAFSFYISVLQLGLSDVENKLMGRIPSGAAARCDTLTAGFPLLACDEVQLSLAVFVLASSS